MYLTYWSVAQKKNRETEAEGLGWELFKNYLIAKEKFKPDFFLYENNKSASSAIKDQISRELGVDLMYINSALVSAQNRQRFYAFNWEVGQPDDKGILLNDILESGVAEKEKAYCLCSDHVGTTRDYFKKHQSQIVFEQVPMNPMASGKARTLVSGYANQGVKHIMDSNANPNPDKQKWDCIAEPLPEQLKDLVCDRGRVYEVVDGHIDTKFGKYPVSLEDGYYLIRKLSVTECCRLQTLPDNYCRAVSATQGYKGIGNGWTADVIIHILEGALKDVPRNEEIIVLSMYDGIGTGRYCLNKRGFTNVTYYAYEIDKYAKQVAHSNYPDIIDMGDAFQVREDDWKLPLIQPTFCWYDKDFPCCYPIEDCDMCPANPNSTDPYWGMTKAVII